VHFRLYRSEDFASLYAIEEVCFNPPLRFGRSTMRELIESPTSATWIAEGDNGVAGFAIVEWTLEPGQALGQAPGHASDHASAYIPTIEVSPQHRRRGIGVELLRHLEASASAAGATLIWLHVDAENEPAIRLYRAEGYRQQGRHEHYYARYRAANIYMKQLHITSVE
jgi:ribosomal-protein-alanine N-acetyltransferase